MTVNISVDGKSVCDRSPLWQQAFAALVLTLLTWPIRLEVGSFGVDSSYLAGLAIARDRGFDFGREVIFNFGPLGFLASEPHNVMWGRIAWVVQIMTAGALAFIVVGLLDRRFKLWVGTCLAAVLSIAVYGTNAMPLVTRLVLISMLWSISHLVDRNYTWPLQHILMAGIFCGLTLLIKADTGLVCLIVVASAATAGTVLSNGARSAIRSLAILSAGMGGAIIIGFGIAGGPLTSLPVWGYGTLEIVRSFSASLGLSRSMPIAVWEQLGAISFMIAMLTTILLRSDLDRRRSGAVMVVTGIAGYLTFRQGFVRYDEFHVTQSFAAFASLPIAFSAVWPARRILIFIVATFVVFLPGQKPAPSDFLAPVQSVRSAALTGWTLVSPQAMRSEVEERRLAAIDHYRVPSTMLDQIGGDSVAILPDALDIAFAYPKLRWTPLPVFQDYQVNTEWLDKRNADRLANPSAPRWILRRIGSPRVDHHFPRFEAPQENLAVVCSYQILDTTDQYELLRWIGNRCGSLLETKTDRYELDQEIHVPISDDNHLIVGRFRNLATSPLDHLLGTLYRGRAISIQIDDDSYRFIPGTGTSWHVLAAPDCVDLGETGNNVRSFAVNAARWPFNVGNEFQVEFAQLPVRCD